MADAPEGTLRLSEAAKQCGVTVDVLKELIAGGHLEQGVVRAGNGHTYLRQDAVPHWDDIAELLRHRLDASIAAARRSTTRVLTELEAVNNDLTAAEEDPLEELGYDLVHFDAFTHGRREKSFGAALMKLQLDLHRVQTFSDALRQAHRVP